MLPVANLSFYNQLGRLDTSRLFAPFGVQPERGSYLLVGSPEFSTPRPKSVVVRMEWQNLPSSFDFARHYEGYGASVGNSSFKIAASFLSGGRWHALDLPSPWLFRTSPENPFLFSEFTLTPPASLAALSREDANQPLEYSVATTDGFFRLELIEPAFGFGAGIYAQALTDATMRNATTMMQNTAVLPPDAEPRKILPLPNAPFTPIAGGISVFSK